MTTLDQMLSSASNALLVFVIAQSSSVEQFGTVAVLLTFVTTWLGFNRGALGMPILLTSDLPADDVSSESGYATSWAVITSLTMGGVFVIAGGLIDAHSVGIALAISVVPVAAQDVLRFCAIAQGRPRSAVICDAMWAAWMAVLYLVNSTYHALPPEVLVYLWGAGGFVSGLLLAFLTRSRPRYARIFTWWRWYQPARVRFGFVYAANQVGAAAVAVIAATVVGSVATGGLRGAATLFGPIAMLISALPLVFLPHSRNTAASVSNQWRLLVKTSVITSGMTSVAAVCLWILPAEFGSAILGDTWIHAHPLIPLIGIEAAEMCWVVSGYAFLQALGRSLAVVRLRTIQLVVQLFGVLMAGLIFTSALAIAVALSLSGLVTLIVVVATASFFALRSRAPSASIEDVAEAPGGAVFAIANEGKPQTAQPYAAVSPWPAIAVLERDRSDNGQ